MTDTKVVLVEDVCAVCKGYGTIPRGAAPEPCRYCNGGVVRRAVRVQKEASK